MMMVKMFRDGSDSIDTRLSREMVTLQVRQEEPVGIAALLPC